LLLVLVSVGKVVYLVRHAERMDFNSEGEWDNKWPARAIEMGLDPTDAPLTEQGIIQAAQAAIKIREEPKKVFTSPFLRCAQTAEIIASEFGVELKISTDLTEWMNVEWFWACYKHLEHIHFTGNKAHFLLERPIFPESEEAYTKRAARILDALKSMDQEKFPLVIVSHGGGIHNILEHHDSSIMMGKKVEYADVFRIEL